MRKLAILTLFSALVCAIFAGCGHNAITYGDGVMLETQINPENWTLGISFRYGKILTVCARENVKFEMEGAGSGNASTGGDAAKGGNTGATSTGKVKFTIGRQISGYFVDAVKAGAKPEELIKYTDSGEIKIDAPNDSGNPASAPKTPENAK